MCVLVRDYSENGITTYNHISASFTNQLGVILLPPTIRKRCLLRIVVCRDIPPL